jgi:hypothetical protein
MCGITILIYHPNSSLRHLIHHRIDLCESRKNTSLCSACRSLHGEVNPLSHNPACPFRRHDGMVCDNLSWWALERPSSSRESEDESNAQGSGGSHDDDCPVCSENQRIREGGREGEQKEVNAKCDVWRYCGTLCGGPCPFLMVVPEDCGMGWQPQGLVEIGTRR